MGIQGIELDSLFSTLTEILNSETSFEHKAEQVLTLGAETLGVDHAHLTRIVPESDYWEVIVSTDPVDGAYPVGETADLQTTYCRRTLEREEPLAIHDAPNQAWSNDIAYETHELNTYLGTTLQHEERPIGTLCFVDKTARSEPFDATAIAFVDWLTSMLLSEFKLQEQDLAVESYTRLVTIFSRILRHNLRNDLMIIRGQMDILIEKLEEPDTDPTQLRTTINRLIRLVEKSKELRQIAEQDSTLVEQTVTALIEEHIEAVKTEYPTAMISLTTTEDVRLLAFPSLQTAIYELLENAVKHSGEDPKCTVRIESDPDVVTIDIADNGPGLPVHEQSALEGELGTPINHNTGVGLYMVWWVVKSHNGTIQVSVTETGTTVTISIPRPMSNRELIERPRNESRAE